MKEINKIFSNYNSKFSNNKNNIKSLFNLEIFIRNSLPLLCLIFCIVQLTGSIGQINRYDLLEQLAISDNLIWNGKLYPSPIETDLPGVSAYFPGVAIICNFFSKSVLNNYVIEIMLTLAFLILIGFILIQKKIFDRIIEEKSSWVFFLPSVIILSILLTNNYLFYARELKPDTIALLLGYSGLIIANLSSKDNRINFLKLFLSGILCGIPIIFKQQYIAFTLGILFYSFLFLNKRKLVFALGVLSSSTILLIKLFNIEYLDFWTIKVLADDGLLAFKSIVLINYDSLISFVAVLVLSVFLCDLDTFQFSLERLKIIFLKCLRNEFTWVILPSMMAAFASALKVGGNQGNTELGIFLLIPILLLILRRISNWKIICIAWISVALIIPSSINNIKKYQSAMQYKDFASNISKENIENVLTGSDVYFASRVFGGKAKIVNYWTICVRDGTNGYPSLDYALNKVTKAPNIIFAENWNENKETLISDKRYDIVFENTTGIIAKLKLSNL